MYLQLVSIHGLVRGTNVEMGRDADTGGQIRYVLELARKLAEQPGVDAVDLFTRRIRDRRFSEDYSQDTESISSNCRIVRLPCGGGRYVRKERLWPMLDEFVDGMIAFTRRQGRQPTLVHGHYADGGYVAREVADAFDAPFVFTGHSLGKPKLEYLLREGWTPERADDELAMGHRIRVEQECLDAADLVVCSTRHERDHGYGQYAKDDSLPIRVIPPGTDLDRFFPYYDYEIDSAHIDESYKQSRMGMQNELGRFYSHPEKPLILALCRPDRRKNIGALMKAYGESAQLKAIANLAIFAGIRTDIEQMPENEQRVLTDLLLAMDRYNLYGKLAIPKHHDSEYDVPELYRLAASSRGVFVNTAFVELFGLTAIEAGATGLPFVATQNGGPQDIYENCHSGRLVDVNEQDEITAAISELLTDPQAWNVASNNGINRVRELYTWQAHSEQFLAAVQELAPESGRGAAPFKAPPTGKRLASVERLLITDIDNTLLGDDAALQQLKELLAENHDRLGFGVASGRSLELCMEVLEEYGLQNLDLIISSVGAEVYYGGEASPDKGWATQLRAKWRPDRIHDRLDKLGFLTLQDRDFAQREFKISYDVTGDIPVEEAEKQIRAALADAKAPSSVIISHGAFVDVLPHRASKGKAIRRLAAKWNLSLGHIATAGDSGNDADMLAGQTAGIVVGNHSPELAHLKDLPGTRVYFAKAHCAAGIIEGLHHYGFVGADVGATAAT
ncbi:Mannosylfructose-phosphate synthase [Pirellulimonas nuda]|uniref:sucrose-phosphate synthase n=1 Tax=Pirellulimonas nuda TaxID=2528009 RepID=A0A518D6L8_9BACT|nr:HAD-IIB family hydrolase [Pirellulimonas nuda]QDU87130.1 Mannosylfructose-phosphate synthase [Pirellulimonas nuda]